MNINKLLENKRIVIATHVYATGPSHSLEDYLKDKVSKLLFIGHPFVYSKDKRSHYRSYKDHVAQKEKFYSWTFDNQTVSLIKDAIIVFFLTLRYGKFDLFVGVDSANTCVGIVLKWMGIVHHVAYYTIDYVPNRLENKFLNKIYHSMDFFAVKHSDVVWNLSSIMATEREKKGMSAKYRKKQIVVPVGTEVTQFQNISVRKKKYHIAHMGHILRKQGVQMLIESIPLIKKKIPTFHIEIIGGGEYESVLKKLVKKFAVSKYVTFYGFIKSHEDVAKHLAACQLGVAPYTDDADNYVRYTDPGKVKAYLAVGLPVVVTKVPEVAYLVNKKKCGIAVDYNAQDIADAIISLLTDRERLATYQNNAYKVAHEFSWEKIFTNALQKSL